MIVKNESALLERCLQSILGASDEIIVVDTGSTDSTVDIAKNCGAKVICTDWKNDFALARNISVENATCEWILWLDADDVVPPESIPLINDLKKTAPNRIYGFTVRNQRPNNTGSEFVQARMFPNRRDIYFERAIHEQMMPSALRLGLKMEPRKIIIEHHGYADPATLKKKAVRNVNLLLQEYNESSADTVTSIEIADSFQLIEDFVNAEIWYKKTLLIVDCEAVTPTLAGHAHLGLGNIYNTQKKYALALKHLNDALRISPWRPDIYYSLAVSYELDGNIPESIRCLKTIFTLEPKPGQVGVDFRSARLKSYLRLIRILTEQNLLTEASKLVTDSLSENPDRPELYNAAGRFLIKCNRLIDALHAFEKSIALAKEGNVDGYLGLCVIYKLAGMEEKVFQTLDTLREPFARSPAFQLFDKYMRKEPIDTIQSEQLKAVQREYYNCI
jgi:glycosyltransferase involved in cell wall biosynthesis